MVKFHTIVDNSSALQTSILSVLVVMTTVYQGDGLIPFFSFFLFFIGTGIHYSSLFGEPDAAGSMSWYKQMSNS